MHLLFSFTTNIKLLFFNLEITQIRESCIQENASFLWENNFVEILLVLDCIVHAQQKKI